eukprot:g8141.t1
MAASHLVLTLLLTSAGSTNAAVGAVGDLDPEPAALLLDVAAPLLPGGRYYTPGLTSEASWQAANTLETLSSLALAEPTAYGAVRRAFDETLAANGGIPHDFAHFDDFGWWALALLRWARVMTGASANATDTTVLNHLGVARTVFDMYVQRAWNTTQCGGGVFWGPVTGTPSYKNAITNELFLALAAALHAATGEARFAEWARAQWAWLGAGPGGAMRGPDGLYNDGLDGATCANNNGTTWTYNQGVILGALASLAGAAGSGGEVAELLRAADGTARATMGSALLAPAGVLREPCELRAGAAPSAAAAAAAGGGCNGDQRIFKGVFVRHLWYLSGADACAPENALAYRAFIGANAAAAIARGRRGGGRSGANATFGLHWAGPFDAMSAGAATQSAALDLILAAAFPLLRAPPPVRARCNNGGGVGGLSAWQRPGMRLLGDIGELLPRGRSLAQCQQACLARPSSACAGYTFTIDGLLGRNNICNAYGNTSSAVLDTGGCGARGGCRYTSGARSCFLG